MKIYHVNANKINGFGTTTMENSMELPYKTIHRTTI